MGKNNVHHFSISNCAHLLYKNIIKLQQRQYQNFKDGLKTLKCYILRFIFILFLR